MRPPGWRFFSPPTFPETRVFFLALGRMQEEICSSNSPVVTGIRDPNKSRARHHPSLKPGSKIKYLKAMALRYLIFEPGFKQTNHPYKNVFLLIIISSLKYLGRNHIFLERFSLRLCLKFFLKNATIYNSHIRVLRFWYNTSSNKHIFCNVFWRFSRGSNV